MHLPNAPRVLGGHESRLLGPGSGLRDDSRPVWVVAVWRDDVVAALTEICRKHSGLIERLVREQCAGLIDLCRGGIVDARAEPARRLHERVEQERAVTMQRGETHRHKYK